MDALFQKVPQVRTSYDNMKAYIYLPEPDEGKYTVEEVMASLQSSGVSYGINEDKI